MAGNSYQTAVGSIISNPYGGLSKSLSNIVDYSRNKEADRVKAQELKLQNDRLDQNRQDRLEQQRITNDHVKTRLGLEKKQGERAEYNANQAILQGEFYNTLSNKDQYAAGAITDAVLSDPQAKANLYASANALQPLTTKANSLAKPSVSSVSNISFLLAFGANAFRLL